MFRWLRPAPAAIGALLFLVGASAEVWVGNDWLKPRIEAAVQRATGRALGIDGTLYVDWDYLTVTVTASDVALANMPGGSRPLMAQAGKVRATVAFWPLLRGRLRVTELRLTDPRILLERDAAGAVNWQLRRPVPAASPGSSPSLSSTRPGRRWEFRLDRLTTEGGVLAWHDAVHAVADGQRPMPAISADITQSGVVVALATTLGAEPLRATVSVGSELLRGVDAPVKASLTLAGATATAFGTAAPNGVTAAVAVRVSDLARLAALAGRASPGSGPLSLDAQVNATRQGVALTGLRMAGPPGDVAGSLTWTGGERPTVVADLAARHLDLAASRAVATALRPAATTAPPAGVSAAPPLAPAHVISDQPLPFAGLNRLDADIRLRVETLANPDVRDVAAHLLLRDGRATLDPFTADAGGRLDGALRIDARQPVPTVSMTLRAPSLALPALLALARLPAVAAGAVALDADLRATGHTPHELAATLTGTAHAASAGATLDQAVFTRLLSAARLPAIGGEARLRCMVANLEAAAGQVTVTPLALDFGRVSVQGEGHVDLDTETLAMQLRPMLRTGPGITLPLRLSGSWRAPKLSSDLGAALTAGGADPCATATASGPAMPSPSPPAATPGKSKRPKPIDILRELLR